MVSDVRKRGVAVVVCPNDLLTQKLKIQLIAIDTLNQKHQLQHYVALKSSKINRVKPVMIIGVGAQNAKDELREFVEAAKIQ